MFNWLKVKWNSVKKSNKEDYKDFKKDERGHARANRYDTDDELNDPEDFATPPIRLPKSKKGRAKLWELLRQDQ